MPTVSIIASSFMKQAALVASGIGMNLAIAEYPGAPMMDGDAELRAKIANDLFPEIIKGLTTDTGTQHGTSAAEPEPGTVVFNGTLDEVEEYFHQQLWSDGLPIIPPTRERVDAFLKFTDRESRQVIAVLPQEGREASVLSIAVNGVMAGCRPEYMPLLIAVVEAISDPEFRVEDCGATWGWEPLVIVNGPIVKDLGFNYGQGAMRIGRQANSSIGRFVRMVLRNICGYRIAPGNGDKGSIGSTFNAALAEDEDSVRRIGWPTYSEDAGFKQGESVVTVQSVMCISAPTYSTGDSAAEHVQQFVDVMGSAFSPVCYGGIKRGRWHPLVVVGPGIAQIIAREWSKDQVKRYLTEKMTMPASRMAFFDKQNSGHNMDFKSIVEEGTLPGSYSASDDPDRLVPIIVKPEHIGVVVAGDPGRNQSRGYMSNNVQGTPTSRRVELPHRWKQLLSGNINR